MIHYHGTPISGKAIDQTSFLTGRHGLVSFAHPAPLPAVMECCQSFILDNGAFSHWKKTGGKIDSERYLDWVASACMHPGFDWCLIPDVIDGTQSENEKEISKWKNKRKIKSVPVWHLNESLDWLADLASEFEIIALGSSGEWSHPGSKSWWHRIKLAMSKVCDSDGRPFCKIHGLRMLNPKIFTKLPLSSADSTNAGVNAGSLSRFGIYKPPTAAQRATVIANRIEMHNSSPVWIDS